MERMREQAVRRRKEEEERKRKAKILWQKEQKRKEIEQRRKIRTGHKRRKEMEKRWKMQEDRRLGKVQSIIQSREQTDKDIYERQRRRLEQTRKEELDWKKKSDDYFKKAKEDGRDVKEIKLRRAQKELEKPDPRRPELYKKLGLPLTSDQEELLALLNEKKKISRLMTADAVTLAIANMAKRSPSGSRSNSRSPTAQRRSDLSTPNGDDDLIEQTLNSGSIGGAAKVVKAELGASALWSKVKTKMEVGALSQVEAAKKAKKRSERRRHLIREIALVEERIEKKMWQDKHGAELLERQAKQERDRALLDEKMSILEKERMEYAIREKQLKQKKQQQEIEKKRREKRRLEAKKRKIAEDKKSKLMENEERFRIRKERENARKMRDQHLMKPFSGSIASARPRTASKAKPET
eukprot:g714.t1